MYDNAVSNDWIHIATIPILTVGAYNSFAISDLMLAISTECICFHECELHNWYIGYTIVHCFKCSLLLQILNESDDWRHTCYTENTNVLTTYLMLVACAIVLVLFGKW